MVLPIGHEDDPRPGFAGLLDQSDGEARVSTEQACHHVDVSDASDVAIFAFNIKGVVFGSQQALVRLREGGRILNVSSSTTEFPMPGTFIYAASKAAPKVFTEVWAKELAPRGITDNATFAIHKSI